MRETSATTTWSLAAVFAGTIVFIGGRNHMLGECIEQRLEALEYRFSTKVRCETIFSHKTLAASYLLTCIQNSSAYEFLVPSMDGLMPVAILRTGKSFGTFVTSERFFVIVNSGMLFEGRGSGKILGT